MSAIRTARDRAREELTREIKDEARRQLSAAGSAGLSQRAVARELGMASSALYRYFPSRDDLLTALIIDAYNAIGECGERAAARVPDGDFLGRWRATCHAVRDWALDHPNEYALVYGSPVPGYQAPRDTVEPASRIPLTLLGLVRDAWRAGRLGTHPAADAAPGASRDGAAGGPPPSAAEDDGPAVLPHAAAAEIDRLAALTDLTDLPRDVLLRTVVAWTQLFGMVSFELFGQFAGVFEDRRAVFDHSVVHMALFVGFR